MVNTQLVPSYRKEGEALVATVRGEIDLNNSPLLRSSLLHLVERHAPKQLVLNLAGVPYMDSSAIAVLVELLRKVGGSGRIVLTDLQPRVKGLLEIARLHTIFRLVGSEREALGQAS